MESTSAIRKAEQAGTYLGAIAVVGRVHKFSVVRIVRDDANWPGTVVFKKPILPHHIVKFAKSGDTRSFRHLEHAVMTNIAGAMALTFSGNAADEERASSDTQLRAMAKILLDVAWWKSQARSHLVYLQHRVVRTLTEGSNWRAVARIAQLLMAQPELSAAQLRQQIKQAASSRTVNGCEEFIMIEEDSDLPGGFEGMSVATKQQSAPPPPPPTLSPPPVIKEPLHDGVVSRDLMLDTFNAINERLYYEDVRERFKQTEPALMGGIELLTICTLGKMKIAETNPQASAIREGITQCGVFVADALHRGHTAMWQKEYDSSAP